MDGFSKFPFEVKGRNTGFHFKEFQKFTHKHQRFQFWHHFCTNTEKRNVAKNDTKLGIRPVVPNLFDLAEHQKFEICDFVNYYEN